MQNAVKVLVATLALMVLAATTLLAATVTSGVTTVNVSSTALDTITVPTQVGLVFPGITGDNYTTATADNVGGLVYSSNTAGRTITAAAASFTGALHAIHLQMKVGAGGAFADLTDATGAAAAAPITVANADTVAGTNTYDLYWSADAAVDGITAGTVYTTAVTFTVSSP